MDDRPDNTLERLNEEQWEFVDNATHRLERAWRSSIDVELAGFVPALDHPLRVPTLIALIPVDQEHRWRAGRKKLLEEYLAEWPELGEEKEILMELLLTECQTRAFLGEHATRAELQQRFPEIADRIDLERVAADASANAMPPSRSLHVRCPHCQNPIEILDDTSLSELVCSECGSSLGVAGDNGGENNAIPPRIGRFELIKCLGKGAFGSVWKARDTDLDCLRAVKIPRKSQLEPQEHEKFLREARAAARLRHPNIVSVHEVGIEDDTIFIVSDFVEGVTLDQWMRDKNPAFSQCVGVCIKIAEALHHAHRHGVIHRDLKPGNILISEDGEPHVVDFGLAKREAGEITMTAEGQILGTPAYMSPEQARGSGHDADRRSDVYSLGVILFELLTGETPFRGNVRMLIKQVLEDEPPRPRQLDSHIPRDLETICLKCLEKSPERRYSSTQEVAEELRRHLRDEPIHARPTGRFGHLWRSCKRYPLGIALTTAFVVVVLGAVVWAYFFADGTSHKNQIAVSSQINGSASSHKNDTAVSTEDTNHPPQIDPERLTDNIPTDGIVTGLQFGRDENCVYACVSHPGGLRQIQKIGLETKETEVIYIARDLKRDHKGFALAADGHYAYVTNYPLRVISRLDLKQDNPPKDMRIEDLPIGGKPTSVWASWLGITPDQSKLVVCVGNDGRSKDEENDQLSIVDIADGQFRLAGEILLDDEYGCGGVAFLKDSSRAYFVTTQRRSKSATLYEVTLNEPYRVERRLGFPDDGPRGLRGVAVSQRLNRVWVSQKMQKCIGIVDLKTFKRTGAIELDGRTPGFLLLNSAQNLLAVICPDSNAVVFVDAHWGHTVEVVENIRRPVPVPTAIFTPDGRSLLVPCAGADTELAVIPVPKPSYPIVFTSNREGGDYEVYTMDARKQSPRRLAEDNRVSDWGPRWSPDGQRVAFVSDRAGGPKICVMNADGNTLNVMENTTPFDTSNFHGVALDWSPDGKSIAYINQRHQIHSVNVETGNVKTLHEGPLADGFSHYNGLCWRDIDGTILVAGQHPADGRLQHLFALNPKTRTARRLASSDREEGFVYLAPAVSPNGQKIAAVRWELLKDDSSELCILDANGENPTPIASCKTGPIRSPRWTPDGKNLVYSADADGFQQLFLIPATGGTPTQLTEGESDNIDPDI